MDKKTIIIIVALSLLILFWVPILQLIGVVKPVAHTERPRTAADSAQTLVSKDTAATTTPTSTAPATSVSAAQVPTSTDSSVALAATAPVETVFVETKKYIVALSSRGGGPVSLKLKEYGYAWNTAEQIEMLPAAPKPEPQIIFKDKKFNTSDVMYSANGARGHIDATSQDRTVTFTYHDSAGGAIEKTYTFHPDAYSYDFAITIPDRVALGIERNYQVQWENGFGATEWDENNDYHSSFGMALLTSERELLGEEGLFVHDWDGNQFSESTSPDSLAIDVNWVGKRSKFFTVIMAPRNKLGNGYFGSGLKFKGRGGRGEEIQKRTISVGMSMPIKSDAALSDSFTVYVGPLNWQGMKSYGLEFETMFDIGTTPFIGWLIKLFAIPIIWLIPNMFVIIPNYGLVIILLGVAIKLVTWPLSRKSVKSMAAMRELGPRMEKLKEKHKNNPQALQQAMMKMYKEAGVNPLASCLPMLPQMPLFFALFSVFNSTILFRGAPFVYPWTDLSRGAQGIVDPYIILVLVMVALMFIQQKMTATDPRQKMMVYLMPLLFGFMFYKFAAGLVIYWTTFSAWSVAEQWYGQRLRSRENAHVKTVEE